MICVYSQDCTDFSSNGLCVLTPSSCTVTETLNGEWELTLEHPLDDRDKWTYLQNGCILRVPVPAAMTPRIQQEQKSGTAISGMIYKVNTQRDPLRLRSGTGTKYRILGKYKKGTQVIVLEKTTSSWYEVSCPDGKRGYMYADYLSYVRTETAQQTAVDEVVERKQLREQPFRIYRTVPELTKVTVYARHIFYDLMDNMLLSYKPGGTVDGATAARAVFNGCQSEHGFALYTDLTTTADDVSFENVNPAEAIMGADGIIEKFNAELARDWFDVYLVERVGQDTDVQIRQGKNLTGITYDVDASNVVTRIVPTGEDDDGETLYLPEKYVDSANIDLYPHPKWGILAVDDAKEDDDNSKSDVYAKLRKAAQEELDKGCDLPGVTLTVNFLNVDDTVEYENFKVLHNIYLGDAVRVVVPTLGLSVAMRMTQYTYDCLLKRYDSCTLGSASEALESSMISGAQLSNGSVSGAKLMIHSVGAGQLQSGAVGSLQVKTAAIGSAHIQQAAISTAHLQEAAIESLNASALTAVSAQIQKLAADKMTADELYAALATIAVAQITTANILNADIDWAQIETLNAKIAKIADAHIEDATIKTAQIDNFQAVVADIISLTVKTGSFDLASITNLLSNALVLQQGIANSMLITNLAVTSANLLNATIDKLVLKGTDGKYYHVFVGDSGTISTEETTVTQEEIDAGQTADGRQITATNANIADLNAQSVKANQAIFGEILTDALTADKITANDALLASATIPVLYTTAITSIGDSIDISANSSITLLTDEVDSVSTAAAEAAAKAANALQEITETQTRTDALEAQASTIQNQLSLTKSGLDYVQTESIPDLEGRVSTIESGVHISGSTIEIYSTDSAYKNQITNDGWVISEDGQPIITCAETKLTAPRVQVTDALIIGSLAWKPGSDNHLRLLKYGR